MKRWHRKYDIHVFSYIDTLLEIYSLCDPLVQEVQVYLEIL